MFRELKTFSALLCVYFSAGAFAVASDSSESVAEQAVATEGVPSSEIFLALDGMFALIQDENPRVLFERETVQRALEQSFQQRAALLPQLALVASQTRQQFGRGYEGGSFDTPPFNSFGTRVEGTQTVFDAEKYANYRIAKLSYAIAQMDYEVAIQDILDQAVQVYFTHLRNLRQVEIVAGNLERSRGLLKLANDQFDAGVVVSIDVTRAEVRVTSDLRDLMIAQTRVESSSLQLKALLDLDLDCNLRLDRGIINDIKSPPTLKRYADMGKSMLDLRPELASQKTQMEQAILARKAAGWQRLPSVELFGDWGYDADDVFDDESDDSWLIGIRASVPIFEGFRISANKREAAALVRQETYQMRVLQKNIDREFRYAMIEMDSRYEEIELARDEIRLSDEEVKQAELRYREGLADNRELIDAQQRLADSERSHLNSAYLYGLSRLAFARAIGAVERVLD